VAIDRQSQKEHWPSELACLVSHRIERVVGLQDAAIIERPPVHSADRPRVEIAGELAVFEYVCKCYVNPSAHGSIWQQAGVVRQDLHASGSVRESRGARREEKRILGDMLVSNIQPMMTIVHPHAGAVVFAARVDGHGVHACG